MSVDGDVEILGFSYTAGGNAKRCGLCGKGFGCSSELKQTIIILPSNSAPRYQYILLKTEKEDRFWKNPERMEREDR